MYFISSIHLSLLISTRTAHITHCYICVWWLRRRRVTHYLRDITTYITKIAVVTCLGQVTLSNSIPLYTGFVSSVVFLSYCFLPLAGRLKWEMHTIPKDVFSTLNVKKTRQGRWLVSFTFRVANVNTIHNSTMFA